MDHVLILVIRISVMLVLGWLMLFCIRKSNPRWTILTLRGLLAAVVIMPFLVLASPEWNIALLPAEKSSLPSNLEAIDSRSAFQATTQPTTIKPQAAAINEDADVGSSSSVKPDITAATTHDLNRKSQWLFLGIIWLIGSGALLMRVVLGWLRSIRVIARSTLASSKIQIIASNHLLDSPKPWLSTLDERVRVSDEVAGPCSAGWIWPKILLPADWTTFATEKDLRIVIAHEASHINGRDLSWDLVARLCQALLWFHPVMWVLPKQHRLACEHLSDAAAASICGDKAEYRKQLASWALQFNKILQHRNVPSISMADRTLLHKRLRWLKLEANSRALTQSAIITALFLWMAVAAVFSSVCIVRAEALVSTNVVDTQGTKPQAEGGSNEDGIPFKVNVQDENGKPVKSAKVGISYIYKNEDDDERAALLVSSKGVNDLGELEVNIPAEANSVGIDIRAEGFVKLHAQTPPIAVKTLKLQRGRVIKVRAMDAEGNLMDNVFPVLGGVHLGQQWERLFKSDGNGNFVSRTVRKDRRWMRVVGVAKDDTLLFSSLIDSTDESLLDKNGIINVRLTPGIKLKGSLDEAVPRPIQNGFVDLCIAETMGNKIPAIQENPRHPTGFIWREVVPVKQDGTFEVESLPSGGHLQLFAMVDDFQSRLPTVGDIHIYLRNNMAIGGEGWLGEREPRHHRILPQLYPLAGNDHNGIVEVTVPCVPTAELEVKVISPTDTPIVGARVTVSPNGRFLPNINYVPGTGPGSGASSSQMVRGRAFTVGRHYEWISRTLYHTFTNKEGIVTLRVPGNYPREMLTVKANGYQMPVHHSSSLTGKPWRHDSVAIVPGEAIQKLIAMEHKIN